jgi:hypothetical protein
MKIKKLSTKIWEKQNKNKKFLEVFETQKDYDSFGRISRKRN